MIVRQVRADPGRGSTWTRRRLLLLLSLFTIAIITRALGNSEGRGWRGLPAFSMGSSYAGGGQDPPPSGQDDSYVAVCMAVKDEQCDIREWVLYHASIGISKLYLFDTESQPPMRPVLEDFIESGLVEYQYVTNSTPELHLDEQDPAEGRHYNWQAPIYDLCLERYGARHRWMAFIDADEFIVLQGGIASLPALLQQYEAHGGVVLHWRLFGSGGHIMRPPGGVLRSYTACCADYGSRLFKSVVQPQHVRRRETVHSFVYKEGQAAVNTAGHEKLHEVSYQGAALHHYISKSLYDFHVKMQRGEGTGSSKSLLDFLKYHTRCADTCTEAVPLGEALAMRYNLSRNVPEACALGRL